VSSGLAGGGIITFEENDDAPEQRQTVGRKAKDERGEEDEAHPADDFLRQVDSVLGHAEQFLLAINGFLVVANAAGCPSKMQAWSVSELTRTRGKGRGGRERPTFRRE
jgi:hypothetical protein